MPIRVAVFTSAAEIDRHGRSDRLPRYSSSDFESQRADLHLCALADDGCALARCSLWWSEAPSYQEHRVGTIGHYAATDDTAAAAVLREAQARLHTAGCTIAIGPMNGNTWRSYRFVTEARDLPPFFLEPTNPPEWPNQFLETGFSPLASYFSAINKDLSQRDARMPEVAQRVADTGVTIRSAHSDLQRELPAIYAVSRISFKNNFLYTELPETAFAAMYEPVLPHARPQLVLLAEQHGRSVGYLFAIPDFAQAARGATVDTFIIKTVAILPHPELRGLGSLLVSRAQEIGRSLGFQSCIHALMFESNVSLNISRHYASVMRRYTLYAKELGR